MISNFTYMSCGGGVQSGTMVEMVAEKELPPPDIIIFADTGDEPDYVYKHIDYLRNRLAGVNVELVTVSAGNIVKNILENANRFAAIPVYSVQGNHVSMLRRQCTREFKIIPIEKFARQEMLWRGLATKTKAGIRINKGITATALIGISLDEVQRAKKSRSKWITNKYPLLEKRMSRNDCINWLVKNNLPIPGKSSCRICPYHNDAFWRTMKDKSPNDWKHVTDFDSGLRNSNTRFAATAKGELFLHKKCIPLADVDFRTEEERGQLRLFDDSETVCDGGYCFL